MPCPSQTSGFQVPNYVRLDPPVTSPLTSPVVTMETKKSALAKVTEDNWRKACEHVEKVEQFYWEKDGLVDEISDRFVINLDDTDTDEELSGGEESEFEEEESAAAANSWSLEGVSTIPPSPVNEGRER
ncbi:hypothetical protein ANN_03614 [Periplaneta americana]|uniref:Uncharacterized protein n=1 Tax=Periplaneta americana TaxID=6978 RepID=A0ABQ8TZE3_PERAM|nr:hypothetical protein ANN_03614 [Periplaneta americana]